MRLFIFNGSSFVNSSLKQEKVFPRVMPQSSKQHLKCVHSLLGMQRVKTAYLLQYKENTLSVFKLDMKH